MTDQEQTTLIPHFTARQVETATLLVMAIVIAFWMLYHFSWVVVVLIIAMVIGTGICLVVCWVSQPSLEMVAAILMIYMALLILMVSFFAQTTSLIK